MFERLKNYWNNNGFEILVILSIALIIIYGLYRIITKKKGSYSKSFFYDDEIKNVKKESENFSENKDQNEFNENKENKIRGDSKGETECRRVLQKIFKRPFLKARPNFLNNPVTGNQFNLELDCYEHNLKLAVEYNGQQHYQYNKFFHRNREHFLNQKYRDDMKRRICKEMGITLIEVPYTVKIDHIEKYLLNELERTGYL